MVSVQTWLHKRAVHVAGVQTRPYERKFSLLHKALDFWFTLQNDISSEK